MMQGNGHNNGYFDTTNFPNPRFVLDLELLSSLQLLSKKTQKKKHKKLQHLLTR